jgi:hypothetical protein
MTTTMLKREVEVEVEAVLDNRRGDACLTVHHRMLWWTSKAAHNPAVESTGRVPKGQVSQVRWPERGSVKLRY